MELVPPVSTLPHPEPVLDSPRPAARPDRVGFWEKFSFGVGTLPVFYAIAGVNSFAIPVYQMTLKIDPMLLGIVLAFPRFLDAVIDPIVGKISDNTHTRWGRRKPYIIVGAIIQAIFFGLIWMVPPTWSSTAITTYLAAMLLLFYLSYSVYSVPLNSLGYEMTPDYDERTNVWAFSSFFNKVGEVTYNWVFPLSGLAIFASRIEGVRIVGWIVAILILGGMGIIPGLYAKERFFKRTEKQEKVKLWPALQATFSNRAFMILLGLTALQIGAGMLASNVDQYLIVYYMFGGDVDVGQVWKAWLSTSYAILGFAWLYPVTWLSKRYGKHFTLAVTFVLVLFGAAGKWFFYTPGHPWKILFDSLLCGPVWVAIYTLTPSMLSDICDDDELRYGFRREGIFGGFFSWVQKTGYSLGFLGAMATIKLTGFNASNANGVQTPGTILAMRQVLTYSTAIWAIAALVLLAFYPLDRKRAEEIRAALEARRGKV